MFRQLASLFTPTEQLFLVHPLQLSRWLEGAWSNVTNTPAIGGVGGGAPQLGSPTVLADHQLPAALRATLPAGVDLTNPDAFTPPDTFVPLLFDHLAYAYLVESTGAFEILAEIVRRLVRGETLGELRAPSVQWARATEELFFREPPLYSVGSVWSQLRPNSRIARRNAYWRMFGLDLPHPLIREWSSAQDEQTDWKRDVGSGANTGFRERWSEFLRQVWLGLENANNQVGSNATDREYVALLCQAIDDMLGMRRRGGQLAREEFFYVTTMSWFHLTIENNTPIVVDLQATATSPAERLAKLGERVGMAPAARARELFELADPMSALLWAIELGSFNTGVNAQALFVPPGGPATPPSLLNQDVNRIIDLWQSATGERVKDRPVGNVVSTGALTTASAQPVRVPTPGPRSAPPLAVSGNGARV
jgi:hypothetical protein